MWKLTIVQKRKSEFLEYMNEHSIQFVSNDLHEIIGIVELLMAIETDFETSFKIDKVVKEGESNEVGI